MRDTKPHGQRDLCMTPLSLARAIVERLVVLRWLRRGDCVLEPSAGDGAFVRALVEAGMRVHCCELRREEHAGLARLGATVVADDFLTRTGCWDAVVGNPPYSDADRHVAHALRVTRPGGTVAMLLKAGWMMPRKRDPLRPAFAHLDGITPRPRFRGEGQDMSEYALHVWSPDRRPGDATISWAITSEHPWHVEPPQREGRLLTHAEVAAATTGRQLAVEGKVLPSVVTETAAAMAAPIQVVEA